MKATRQQGDSGKVLTNRVLTKLHIEADEYCVYGLGVSGVDGFDDFWIGFLKDEGDVESSEGGIEHIPRQDLRGLVLREELGIPLLYLQLRTAGDVYEREVGRLEPDRGDNLGLQKAELEAWVGFVKQHYRNRFGMEI